ncbi:DNA processing protein [Liquorilactobacillus oeni DSM 19972]|uniref:DNA processing protein n=1 Tax=Liquorilactobacillus oeni DSM 19972 TaxID=1423777 RepID=A0A0R1MGQ6_9LACO|nr:DNA processing protein [Liquorilactobacillus oeni DSM 19972]
METILGLSAAATFSFWKKFSSSEFELMVDRNYYHSHIITLFDKEYPPQLREIYDPPNVLFCRGDLGLLNKPLILAIVGARQNSNYAQTVLRVLLPEVISSGIVTLSGLANGVDSLCHRQTIFNGGKTIAVIGSGLDVFYPKQNRELQQQIARSGLLLSEYGLGVQPRKYHFPARNRIIAGLAQTTLVVEAKHHSGSLITANLALQENRNVLAVPGPITSTLSVGTNELILAGAKPVLKAQDIIEEFLNT